MSLLQTGPAAAARDAKSKYRELCSTEPGVPLFDQDWWLDAVCGGPDNWDVALVERGGRIVASMPYRKTKKSMFEVISMPQLTLTMGVWIRYPEFPNQDAKLSYEREIYTELIEQIPAVDYFNQQLHWDNTNWSIFYWKGFRQTSRFTYVLEDTTDLERVYGEFSDKVKADIAKAEGRIRVVESDDLDLFQATNSKMFDPPRFSMPYSYETLKAVDERCRRRNRRKILLALDADGNAQCALYLVWDDRCTYYLLGGETPEAKMSGAHSLLVWHAIREMSKDRKAFDFHGGMHEPIERIYRSFGAAQKPYFQISKINGKLFKFAYYLKQAIR
ncbi:GNAT family N-acetyltransferase [Cohnella candidum]|uniref:GNAT family N-acetyltransferase n=1 Tax=Cohnella candidum TaxID=2674991 RepID=A0A3G3K003_9BACL|nr:GNAT family N-acetyltransferase [Cohnella candidum]AYQ73828.1 GNAT family N-acetyltransferase [Cohnella candidum]